jgi:F0F1-type ATP synthase epsilon subunit
LAEPPTSKMTDKSIHVLVQDRSRVLYDGEATGVSSKNSKGIFDILLNHANFISLLNETLIIHQAGGGDKAIPMTNAIVKAKENRVEVYVGVKR